MNEEKRLQRRQRLMDNKAYQTMEGLARYMDRYYLDALIGVIFPRKQPKNTGFRGKNKKKAANSL
jgi:hypothetical protein